MSAILVILLVLFLAAYAVRLAQVVGRDGLGSRRPPRSHPDWWEGAHPT
ncbi:hypothetical protein GCM10009809_02570 [Isoptericola hypogeus]|uniref:Uncharacterized protein n=1 Tax=Isoptericola hypogeus TaxID=300179 RepID=A0ABN2IQE9_9MICO